MLFCTVLLFAKLFNSFNVAHSETYLYARKRCTQAKLHTYKSIDREILSNDNTQERRTTSAIYNINNLYAIAWLSAFQ